MSRVSQNDKRRSATLNGQLKNKQPSVRFISLVPGSQVVEMPKCKGERTVKSLEGMTRKLYIDPQRFFLRPVLFLVLTNCVLGKGYILSRRIMCWQKFKISFEL